jgi:hypothetical protein
MSNYNTEFAGQQQILGSLMSAFQPMLAAGPDQQGFGPQERAALATQIGEGTAANYAKASQALNTQLGARGGGNEFLPTGARAQIDEALAAQAAQTQSNQQLQMTAANYAQGRANFGAAAGALSNAAGLMNPTAAAGAASGAGVNAMNSANQIWQQGNEWVGAVGGALGGAMSMAGMMVGG